MLHDRDGKIRAVNDALIGVSGLSSSPEPPETDPDGKEILWEDLRDGTWLVWQWAHEFRYQDFDNARVMLYDVCMQIHAAFVAPPATSVAPTTGAQPDADTAIIETVHRYLPDLIAQVGTAADIGQQVQQVADLIRRYGLNRDRDAVAILHRIAGPDGTPEQLITRIRANLTKDTNTTTGRQSTPDATTGITAAGQPEQSAATPSPKQSTQATQPKRTASYGQPSSASTGNDQPAPKRTRGPDSGTSDPAENQDGHAYIDTTLDRQKVVQQAILEGAGTMRELSAKVGKNKTVVADAIDELCRQFGIQLPENLKNKTRRRLDDYDPAIGDIAERIKERGIAQTLIKDGFMEQHRVPKLAPKDKSVLDAIAAGITDPVALVAHLQISTPEPLRTLSGSLSRIALALNINDRFTAPGLPADTSRTIVRIALLREMLAEKRIQYR
ncbi:hypothetical protein [Amycolatopsis sp. cmx-4-61]|uniref:hypothetical protein n=1 Tax=Amycolatopsis sp. cmx-4-61 TaxID=2790937 RepID=UPI00397B50B4